jgi:UDP-N-acetylglucosamine 1-carboxyvinyltransferase
MSLPSAHPDDVFVVRGGSRLSGTVRVQGAKNSALKLFAAALLTPEPTILRDVPAIADVPVMAELVRSLGCDVVARGDGVFAIGGVAMPRLQPDPAGTAAIRASTSLLGALVARRRRARLTLPGGDRIGARSIDLHLAGLTAMGARVIEDDDAVDVSAPRLHGADITLEFPSVGATENLVMAATLADGVTTIDNAAREPEIQDLCRMLVAMGARIEGIGSATVRIRGVAELGGVDWTVVPDRIEAGTWASAAAVTRGRLRIDNVRPADLLLTLTKLRSTGVAVEEGDDHLLVRGDVAPLRPTNVVTLPYPGFPTDMQPQMMVLLSQADGASRCTENVFESRFSFVDELARMGADIKIDGHHAIVRGPTPLHGARLKALDVRAGAAGVLAGLVADGETVVTDVHHIDRGYEDFVGRLRRLGADVERVPGG